MNTEKQKFIPYGRHKVSEKDIKQVVEVLKNKNLTQGEVTDNFEKAISDKVGSNYCVAVNSATSALHISCLAIGLNKNDILWTSTNSFVASANCGAYCGAEIDFVDIDPKTGLMSINKLSEKLALAKKQNKLPKLIIPVHLTGSVCDMEKLNKLAIKYKFSVVEDASHAIGAKYKGSYVGNCKFSDMTVFSFHPVKIITTGEGGCVTTNNENLAKNLYKLRSHGITKNKNDYLFIPPGEGSYEQQLLGYNYRLSDIHSALGFSQLKRLDKIVMQRNKMLELYRELLEDQPINFLDIPKDVLSSVHLAVIRLENKDPLFHKYIFDKMKEKNIGLQVHYTPIHLQPFYRKRGFSEGDFPQAEYYSKNALSIPLFIGLSREDQFRVSDALKDLLRK